jgi:hypothetical protein
MELRNTKVLLICPAFFGYQKEIITSLESLGATVEYLQDRPFSSHVMRGLTSLFPVMFSRLSEIGYFGRLKNIKKSEFDIVFVVNGQTVSAKFLKFLHHVHPQAKFVLYLWDSVVNRPHVVRNFCYFDKIFTFDERDSVQYELAFRPLFYIKDYSIAPQKNFSFDISFIGTIHSDRFSVLTMLRDKYKNKFRFHYHLYLQTKWVFLLYKFLKPSMRVKKSSDFRFFQLPVDKVQEILEDTVCVVDIEHPDQSGLTIRTIEAVFSGRKLITTNSNIVHYDFYNGDNILVIDRKDPVILDDFLEGTVIEMKPNLVERYSIKGWLRELLLS